MKLWDIAGVIPVRGDTVKERGLAAAYLIEICAMKPHVAFHKAEGTTIFPKGDLKLHRRVVRQDVKTSPGVPPVISAGRQTDSVLIFH